MKKTVHLVLKERIGTIAPEIYGHFSEHIGGVFYDGLWVGKDSKIPNINGFRKDIIEKLRKIKIPVLRWPGGCFAETYDWRDGIGPNRPTRINWWTEKDHRYETNEVGTHEFVELCNLIGAKPYFAVNVTSITPMEARNWMDYCLSPKGTTTLAKLREENGHPDPFYIPYWGIGNENWGGGGHMTPEYYALEFRKFATVLANVPTTTERSLIAGGANSSDYIWTHKLAEGIDKVRRLVDGMSFHYYCGTAGDAVDFNESEWYELLEKAEKMENLVRRHYAIVEGYGLENQMKLVIDEWGCWHRDGSGPSKGYNLFEQQSTMRDAVISALTLNIFNNHCEKIKMANAAQLCNNLHALFLAGGEHCITTPTYHVFDIFKEHQGAEAIRSIVEDNEEFSNKISISASVKNDSLTVTVANYSCTEDVELDLNLLGGSIIDNLSLTILAGEKMNSCNTFESPHNVTPTYKTLNCDDTIIIPAAGVVSIETKIK